jgi:hypothetical protein
MIKHRLRERLTTRSLTNIRRKSKRFVDREVRFNGIERGSGTLFLRENMTTSTIKDRVDTTHGGVGTENLDEEDRFLESWHGEKFRGVENTTTCGDDLSSSTVDGVGMECYVLDVETNTSHGFFSNTTFLGCPGH